MGPYSHLVVARELEAYTQPADAQEYYWGAIAPDVRYLVVGMSRTQTHISVEKILGYVAQYPELKDFLKGYLVHCLSDEIDFPKIMGQKFPFCLQKEELAPQHSSVIFEFFNIERVKPASITLSGKNNTILKEMGVKDAHAAKFSQAVGKYIAAPSYAASVKLFQNLGFMNDSRVEKYRDAAAQFQNHWIRSNLIILGLQIGKAKSEIVTSVRAVLPVV